MLFYVQHLLGIGHLRRAALLVEGWQRAGLDVAVVLGGLPVAGITFGSARVYQLPPLQAADADFSALVDPQGQALSEPFKQGRRQQLLALLAQEQPDILMLETYPFGRRQLRWELLPLLELADQLRPRPLICSSVRDILQRRKPEREAETLALIAQYFDRVQVHGDPAFVTLPESVPGCSAIAQCLDYTGYVTDSRQPDYRPQSDAEVVVSAGGGAVGFELLRCAIESRPLGPLSDRVWRVLLGPNVSPEARRKLAQLASDRVVLESVRPDFTDLLSRCALSISQGGYNTLMDLLGAGCPAVVVPFEGQGETEQRMRCDKLAAAGVVTAVNETELTPQRLAMAITRALHQRRQPLTLARDGARRSAALLIQRWQQYRSANGS